jgi:hypothetical protein
MRFANRLMADIPYVRAFARMARQVRPIAKSPTRIFPALIDELATRCGERPALLSERETFT